MMTRGLEAQLIYVVEQHLVLLLTLYCICYAVHMPSVYLSLSDTALYGVTLVSNRRTN